MTRCRTSLRALIVEDEAVNRLYLSMLLEEQGLCTRCARDGEEAVRLCAAEPFDLIIMDLEMPRMGGLEALALIRSRESAVGRHSRVIALTAHAGPEDIRACTAAGADDHLRKPFDESLLLAKIAALREGKAAKSDIDTAR